MTKPTTHLAAALCGAAFLLAAPLSADEAGELNPPEMSLDQARQRAMTGQVDTITCSAAVFLTKRGEHAAARDIFEACARAGYTQAMTWMSFMEDNGYGAPRNPDAATDWSRQAAEAGDPIGKFNYGISLMRGWGVAQDVARGRALVDEAAQSGLGIAQRLRGADYDLEEVTPDADSWRYAPLY